MLPFFCFLILLANEFYWWRIRKTYRESIGSIKTLIAGKCWLFIQEVRKSGRLARSQAFVWSPWDEKPFSLASWGLLDTLFPRWASLCSNLQRHFHKTLSLWFQLGLCVADCTLTDFQRLLLLLF